MRKHLASLFLYTAKLELSDTCPSAYLTDLLITAALRCGGYSQFCADAILLLRFFIPPFSLSFFYFFH
jgi:hypothetical protein